jgi:hypothetical protein
MTGHARKLLRDALSLPLKDRAVVAAELLASLDEPAEAAAEVQAAWAEEIERRARRVLAGEAGGRPWAEVHSELESRFSKK